MKDLPSSAQSAIEYGVVALLVAIIIAGSYKLYHNWTHPETEAAKAEKRKAKIQKLMEKPSKELCNYVIKQCSMPELNGSAGDSVTASVTKNKN